MQESRVKNAETGGRTAGGVTGEIDGNCSRTRVQRGPRGQRGEIRERIRSAARQEFIAHGYDGATIRQIARVAGCDSAMVSYYFDSKQRLFRECFDLPADPAAQIVELLLEDVPTAGERMVRYVLTLYEERLTGGTLRALMRALMTDIATNERFRNYIRDALMHHVADELGISDFAAEQIELAMAQMYGVVTMRYVVRLEPIASMPLENLIQELGPLLQQRINVVFGERV